MKKRNREKSDNLKRALDVLTSDRMGVSSEIEWVINREIHNTLSNFFALSGDVKTVVRACPSGFDIVITCNAKSVKQVKFFN